GLSAALPAWLRGRRGLIIAATAVITAGLVLNWGWLTAIGAAPILLALAPCAVMCGLGLCMRGGSGKSRSSGGSTSAADDIDGDSRA
ncbi:MAG: hypothetical protein ACE5EU_15145, partial [Paracoccaceae bacterium]